MLWNRVLTEGCDAIDGAVGIEPVAHRYVPLACQHCENPACMKVCPTGATYKDDAGRVEIEYDRCIGCRMCMAACPFNARVFNWEDPQRDGGFNWGDARVPVRTRGVMEKCTLCRERTDEGEAPMCVVCCPTHARVFGDLTTTSELAQLRSKARQQRASVAGGVRYEAPGLLLQRVRRCRDEAFAKGKSGAVVLVALLWRSASAHMCFS